MKVQALLVVVVITLIAGAAWAVPPQSQPKPYVELSFASNPVAEGTSVNITVSAWEDSSKTTAVTVGKLQLRECQDSSANPLPNTDCDSVTPTGTYFVIAQSGDPNGTGSFTYSFDTTGLGGKSIGFQGNFAPGSSGGSTWAGNQSPSANLVVTSGCTGDLQFAVSSVSADNNPANNNTPVKYSYTVTLTACVDLSNIKVQGGTNGWGNAVTLADLDASTGSLNVRSNNKNQVITWTIPSLSEGATASLTIEGTGRAKADNAMCAIDSTYLTPRYVNGAWSAVYTVVDTGVTSKSDYSTPSAIQVLCY